MVTVILAGGAFGARSARISVRPPVRGSEPGKGHTGDE